MRCLVLLLLPLFACAPERTAAAASTTSALAAPGHHLLTLELIGGRLVALDARRVALPSKKPRAEEPRAWRLEARDASGATLAATSLDAAGVVRGEFPSDSGALSNQTFAAARVVFTARLDDVGELASLHLLALQPDGVLVELGSSTWPVPSR